MFTENGWQEWVKLHKALLVIGRDDKEYDALLEQLKPLFRRLNATAEELEQATLWMVEDAERVGLPWRTHYAMLRKHITALRIQKGRAEEARKQSQHTAKINAERKAGTLPPTETPSLEQLRRRVFKDGKAS